MYMALKIAANSTKRMRIISLLLVILILLAFSGFYIYSAFIQKQQDNTTDSTNKNQELNLKPATEDQKNTGNQIKSNNSSDTPPKPVNIPNSDKKSVQMNITAINQTDSLLQTRVLINAVDSNGQCKITITNSSNTIIEETVEIQSQATISTCKGFDIPMSKLSKGLWNIKIDYTSDNYTSSVTKEYTIE